MLKPAKKHAKGIVMQHLRIFFKNNLLLRIQEIKYSFIGVYKAKTANGIFIKNDTKVPQIRKQNQKCMNMKPKVGNMIILYKRRLNCLSRCLISGLKWLGVKTSGVNGKTAVKQSSIPYGIQIKPTLSNVVKDYFSDPG